MTSTLTSAKKRRSAYPANDRNLATWRSEVLRARQILVDSGQRDNNDGVRELLSGKGISLASGLLTSEITGSNHRELMTRFGIVKRRIIRKEQPVPDLIGATVKLIDIHTPDAKNAERKAVLGTLLGQAGISFDLGLTHENPADSQNCFAHEKVLVEGYELFLAFTRNDIRLEQQQWQTPYAGLLTNNLTTEKKETL